MILIQVYNEKEQVKQKKCRICSLERKSTKKLNVTHETYGKREAFVVAVVVVVQDKGQLTFSALKQYIGYSQGKIPPR